MVSSGGYRNMEAKNFTELVHFCCWGCKNLEKLSAQLEQTDKGVCGVVTARYKQMKFRCQICDLYFQHYMSWCKHLVCYHPKRFPGFSCIRCKAVLLDSATLATHWELAHSPTAPSSVPDNKNSKSQADFEKLVTTKDPYTGAEEDFLYSYSRALMKSADEVFCCPRCQVFSSGPQPNDPGCPKEKFEELGSLQKMLRYPCPVCELRFKHYANWAYHLALRHKDHKQKPTCKICYIPLFSKEMEKLHLKTRHPNGAPSMELTNWKKKIFKPNCRRKTWICTKCSMLFLKPSGLKTHRKTEHGDTRFHWEYMRDEGQKANEEFQPKCPFPDCGEKFESDVELILHFPYSHQYCDRCNTRVTSYNAYWKHLLKKCKGGYSIKEPKEKKGKQSGGDLSTNLDLQAADSCIDMVE